MHKKTYPKITLLRSHIADLNFFYNFACRIQSNKTIMNTNLLKLSLISIALPSMVFAKGEKPNIIFLLSDDIGVKEIPIYGSNEWYDYETNTMVTDPKERSQTPVLDDMARKGCWISTCWACPVSMPSRAMLLSGRYAADQKWWYNRDIGDYQDKNGKQTDWPIYESSPYTLASVAHDAGYATYWAGKTQMPNVEESSLYGFDEGCYVGGRSKFSNFYLEKDNSAPIKGIMGSFRNADAGNIVHSYAQSSTLWKPGVQLINYPGADKAVIDYPHTEEQIANYGVNTYGPDIEMEFILDFIERKKEEEKPFFIYHASHLGHGAFNYLDPTKGDKLPPTPKLTWDGKKYIRTEPNITGEKGLYDAHGTISEPGLEAHLAYLDYHLWVYTQKLKEIGEYENTIFIFSGDNGTGGYGKGSAECQKGVNVPLVFYAPGMKLTKKGVQDIIMDYTDLLPTIADIAGTELPEDAQLEGKSLMPYLTTKKKEHRDFIYSYKAGLQLIRGTKVLRDGDGVWYDVENIPANLDGFPKITDWSKVSAEHRAERDKLEALLPKYDLYYTEYNGPGGTGKPVMKVKNKK